MYRKIKTLMLCAAMVALAAITACMSGPTTDDNGWVDLGLPSGLLWATCNVGADTPEEFGDYFAWGETLPKEEYTWDNFFRCCGFTIRAVRLP